MGSGLITRTYTLSCAGKVVADPELREHVKTGGWSQTGFAIPEYRYRPVTHTVPCKAEFRFNGFKDKMLKAARAEGWSIGVAVRCPKCRRKNRRTFTSWGAPQDVGRMREADRETLEIAGRAKLLGYGGVKLAAISGIIAHHLPGGFKQVKPGDHATAKYYVAKVQEMIDAGTGDGLSYFRDQRANLSHLKAKWYRRAYGKDAHFEVRGTKGGRPTRAERDKIEKRKEKKQ